jgi:phosphatidylglycerophosphatase A
MAAGTQPGSSALQILVFVVELIKNLLYILLSIVAALFLFRMYNEVKIGAQAPTATRKKAKKR